MINIDTRLLPSLDANELWLLCHIIKRFDDKLTCFPSNKTLCHDTGWEIKKLQKTKASLITKGILRRKPRFKELGQSSNFYVITTDQISVYVSSQKLSLILEDNDDNIPKTGTPLTPKTGTTPSLKTDKEVLSTEVLASSSNEEEPQSLFPSEDTNSQKKESKKKEKVPSLHREIQDIWLNEIHPGWAHRGGIDARAIKSMIGNMTKYSKSLYGEQYDPPEEYIKRFFRHFCNSLPEFYKNATIDVLDRKFNSIIDEIKQGTSKQQTGKQRPGSVSSVQQWISSLPTTEGIQPNGG